MSRVREWLLLKCPLAEGQTLEYSAMVHQAAAMLAVVMQGLLQRVEHEAGVRRAHTPQPLILGV
jgi:hypothetical protein